MSSYERAVEYAEYLLALGKQNPAALLTSPISATSKGKSIHQKLLEIYIEETGKQTDDTTLLNNTHLLAKLVKGEKLNCLILNLYPGNEGYSLMLKSKAGIETETFKLPYEVTEFLEYVDDSELPPFLVDILEKAQVNVFYNGCVIIEVRDFRRSTIGSFDTQFVLLRPTPQTLLCDINNLTNDGHVWTQEDLFHLESKLLLATEEPLCLDPSPAVLLVANRQQYERKKLNIPPLKRAVKKYTQAAMNRKRKFAQSAAPSELKLHDFIVKRKEKKNSSLKLGKSNIDSWKQKPACLSAPETLDVEKFAKALDKPETSIIKDNSLNLVEEQVLERDVTQEKKLLAKLTIYHRPGDDAYIGELYLDHDYVEHKSQGTTCKFLLGNKDSVKKYLDQFREIFTEEGRRVVKITTQRPGQAPIVTCTQTTPSVIAAGTVTPIVKVTSTATISQAGETPPATSVTMGTPGGLKRTMPIQLSLSIGQNVQAQTLQQGTTSHSANQLQLNIQPQAMNQSQLTTQTINQSQLTAQQRLQQQTSQSQTASQRLKQLGIHTSIASRGNTPTASPVTSQPPIAQLFGSPTSVGSQPILSQQPNVSKTPTNTPTPTPPPIVSPPPAPGNISRKLSLTSESSTVHHMAQTPHQANIATYIPGETTPTSSTVSHQQPTGITNINIANITGIPPNINIQNLTGLPGMNIANLQGLQNMQVSLSVPGGSIAVPISMISSGLQNQQGLIVTSGGQTLTNTQTVSTSQVMTSNQSNMVTMVTQLPTSTSSAVPASSHIVTVSTPTGMLSLPIGLGGNITQLVPAGIKSHGQLRASTSLPLLQFGQQGLQLVNLPQQRAPLKTATTLQPGQTLAQLQAGVKPSTSISGPLTTTLLTGQNQLSQLSVGKANQQGGITTTLTQQQLLQLPQFQAQLQAFQKPQSHPQQQQLQFHQILKQQSVPTQPNLSVVGGKPKTKKRTTPTPPKQ